MNDRHGSSCIRAHKLHKLHGDAVQHPWRIRPLNIWNFKNPRWRRPPSWKIQNNLHRTSRERLLLFLMPHIIDVFDKKLHESTRVIQDQICQLAAVCSQITLSSSMNGGTTLIDVQKHPIDRTRNVVRRSYWFSLAIKGDWRAVCRCRTYYQDLRCF